MMGEFTRFIVFRAGRPQSAEYINGVVRLVYASLDGRHRAPIAFFYDKRAAEDAIRSSRAFYEDRRANYAIWRAERF